MTNTNSKCLKLGDGMAHVGSAVAFTGKRHLAVRNAIEAHRQGERGPLWVPASRDDVEEHTNE